MSLPDSLVGAVVGAVIGFAGSTFAQDYRLKRDKAEKTNERVYSHLYAEIYDALDKLTKDDSPSDTEWIRITRHDHLGYLIEPLELYESLKTFYETRLPGLRGRIRACRLYFVRVVRRDIKEKVKSANDRLPAEAPSTADAATVIEVFSNLVGRNLHRDSVVDLADTPEFKDFMDYEELQPLSFALEKSSPMLEESIRRKSAGYFGDWRVKNRNEKNELIEKYRESRELAKSDAKHLHEELAKKLGKKLKSASALVSRVKVSFM